MFCDITKIKIKAGTGGNGCMAAKREKYLEFGGPDGGDGGKGGDVVLKVNPHLNSLIKLHAQKTFKAQSGEHGKGRRKHGSDGKDLIIEVPLGTQIKKIDTGEIYDLKEFDSEVIIALGGRGGYGNAHFKSSTRQFPDFAELGEPTDEIDLELELKLIADVGIIGIPSAGKSTFISKITNIKAKIGDYDFTTLVPNIGVVDIFDNSLVITDIPGLIEGAAEGKGLGTEFLRHISRNSVLVHLLNANSLDIFNDYIIVQNELKKYSENSGVDLYSKPQFIVVNKSDLLDKESMELLEKYFLEKCKKAKIKIKSIYFISAITGFGIDKLLNDVYNLVQKTKEKFDKPKSKNKRLNNVDVRLDLDDDLDNEKRIIYTPHLEENPRYFKLTKLDIKRPDAKSTFQVEGKRIVQIAKMTNFEQRGGVERLYDVLKKLGIKNALINLGAEEGDKIKFGDWNEMLDFREDL